jgi:hypothetical protein
LDYASLNPESLRNVEKFAILVISDEKGNFHNKSIGSLIKEVKAPATVARYE